MALVVAPRGRPDGANLGVTQDLGSGPRFVALSATEDWWAKILDATGMPIRDPRPGCSDTVGLRRAVLGLDFVEQAHKVGDFTAAIGFAPSSRPSMRPRSYLR